MVECMAVWEFSAIEAAIRESWGPDTRDPGEPGEWQHANPAHGQCFVTAALLHDLLGGDMVMGEVRSNGNSLGAHYWNRFAGIDIDLTREQFSAGETVSSGRTVPRTPGPFRRCQAQYEILRDRVRDHLGLARLDDH